ncbi:MAG TPA: 2-oxoacid:acceptor oxidoreductase subunit alpha [Tissierellia bacterium]|jgi:2-oxoglutarate ferredoxin oxidoreductase subunit alpha|nr:2-oxoacid:acceptor oxidoreductase subunit alpha [Tissierellia bacterium]
MSKAVLMQGNWACVEGALYAGMRFYSGYPITPSTEIAELSAQKLPLYGGKFIQMEDEISGIAAAIGASISGTKSMTATSGPGFSLKQENIGYAAMTEVPLVIVNVMRVGPSTGLPTASSQADIMQARFGSHGDYPIIAVSPNSVTETFTLTVRAFNLAEKYRTPVMFLTDETIGHAREPIVLPKPGELPIYDRVQPADGEEYMPFRVEPGEIVPRMPAYGRGFRYNMSGLFHTETGFPSNSPENAQAQIDRMFAKIYDNVDDIVTYEEFELDDAELVFVTYGSTSRSVIPAIKSLRKQGYKVGMFRAITLWPSPAKQIEALAERVKHIVVAEMNRGQYLQEVARLVKGKVPVTHIGRANSEILLPSEIEALAKEVLS